METRRGNEEVRFAIRFAEFNKKSREDEMSKETILNSEYRFDFYNHYNRDLGDTITVLKAIEDPSSCNPQELVRIVIENPEVVDAARKFVVGTSDYERLFEEVQDVTIARLQKTGWPYNEPATSLSF